PTKKEFHGWHGDSCYDQTVGSEIPKEVKLALYLTDVESGGFAYIKGSHQKRHPKLLPERELPLIPENSLLHITGPAGSAFIFDTSGLHRQSTPVLEARQAVFFNYHDPAIPLQPEDIDYYRYHPLILNAAFLGNLTDEDRRILGFGDQRNYQHGFVRQKRYSRLEGINCCLVEVTLHFDEFMYYPRRILSQF